MGTNKTKKQKRFDKFVEKQVKKEERVALLEKLGSSTWKNNLMKSSKTLGRKTETKREKLQRAAIEDKLGLPRSDPSVRLYVSERDPEEVRRQANNASILPTAPIAPATAQSKSAKKRKTKKKKRSTAQEPGSSDAECGEPTTAQPASPAAEEPNKSKDKSSSAQSEPISSDDAVVARPAKRPLEEVAAGSALAKTAIVKRKRQKKGRVLEKLGLVERREESSDEEEDGCEDESDGPADHGDQESDFDSSASENDSDGEEEDQGEGEAEDQAESQAELPAAATAAAAAPQPEEPKKEKVFYTGSMLKPLLVRKGALEDGSPGSAKDRAYFVSVKRRESIMEQRIKLPVYAEEQQIMEAITENPVVVLSGETGSGKTTQVPQFLFEAGYGDPNSPNPGIIGITQPRRVAAISMAHRVAEELGDYGSTVAHQVRFDTTVSDKTRVKFMTEGVLLRELANDLLLTKYSVIITDEAHERSLNTDILLGVLSRVVRLRQRLSAESPEKHRPLRLVIMSATLRVDDFVKNTKLFPVPPPVINVQARQHPVRVHFNRRTPAPGQHVSEAIRKVGKIHKRLPDGGILVFLTGQAEITYVCKKLREQFPSKEERTALKQQQEREAQRHKQSPHGKGHKAKRGGRGRPHGAEKGSSDSALVANGLQTSVEDEDVDIGDYDLFTADGELQDDFEIDSASDSEEEGELILGGGDEEECKTLLSENLSTAPEKHKAGEDGGDEEDCPPPLYVLPLYSLLPAEQQLKVFAPPPPGSRLCVVATNVAETSITIPGIRYVVDAGLAKEKTYDAQTQVQSFEVGWTSQASANQRTGRAGRTGPGHCYRIYSSAVFNDQFPRFSEPEIMRMPIEGVVLQMKAMNLDNVTNFPFPTPPSRSALAKAERLLTWLGALGDRGRVTDLGRLMSVFPVAPRFAKMLIVGQQHGCLPYVIAVVAALSVGDPFVKEFHLDADENSALGVDDAANDDDDGLAMSEARAMTNEEMAAKEQQRVQRKQYWRTQSKLAGSDPTSDVLKWLTVVGAFEYAGGTEAACKEYYVRSKAMGEIRKLRGQLTTLVQMYCPGVDLVMDPQMAPPSKLQQSVIRQILLAGFMDHVAVRGDVAGYHDEDEESNTRKRGMHAVPYITMWGEEPVFIHPESVAYMSARSTGSMPQAIVFTELQRTTRLWAKVVTVVSSRWLATIGQPLCTFGNPLPYPLPKYNEAHDHMTCYVEPRFGPKSWLLPMVKAEESRDGTRWRITKVIG
ncbi:P-loop containing nucleoside triphosphate hydrolase protein [Martensiomyces pterosporus]|nr:P-loop containing nucleoside triphosphate hydrolase protein [Martensiomyces pterosporus]